MGLMMRQTWPGKPKTFSLGLRSLRLITSGQNSWLTLKQRVRSERFIVIRRLLIDQRLSLNSFSGQFGLSAGVVIEGRPLITSDYVRVSADGQSVGTQMKKSNGRFRSLESRCCTDQRDGRADKAELGTSGIENIS